MIKKSERFSMRKSKKFKNVIPIAMGVMVTTSVLTVPQSAFANNESSSLLKQKIEDATEQYKKEEELLKKQEETVAKTKLESEMAKKDEAKAGQEVAKIESQNEQAKPENIAKLREALATLKEKVDAGEKKYLESKEKIETNKEKIAEKNEKLDQAKDEVTASNKPLAGLMKKVEQKRLEVTKANEKKAQAEEKLSSAQEALKKAQEDKGLLSAGVNKAEAINNEKVKALVGEAEKVEKNTADLSKEIAASKEKENAKAKEVEKATQAKEKSADLQKKAQEEATKAKTNLEDATAKYNKQIGTAPLSGDNEEVKILTEKVAEATKKIEDLTKRENAAKVELDEAREKLRTAQDLLRKLEEEIKAAGETVVTFDESYVPKIEDQTRERTSGTLLDEDLIELTDFAKQILDSKYPGIFKVTEGSIEFAKSIADNYDLKEYEVSKDNINWGVEPAAITEAAEKIGLLLNKTILLMDLGEEKVKHSIADLKLQLEKMIKNKFQEKPDSEDHFLGVSVWLKESEMNGKVQPLIFVSTVSRKSIKVGSSFADHPISLADKLKRSHDVILARQEESRLSTLAEDLFKKQTQLVKDIDLAKIEKSQFEEQLERAIKQNPLSPEKPEDIIAKAQARAELLKAREEDAKARQDLELANKDLEEKTAKAQEEAALLAKIKQEIEEKTASLEKLQKDLQTLKEKAQKEAAVAEELAKTNLEKVVEETTPILSYAKLRESQLQQAEEKLSVAQKAFEDSKNKVYALKEEITALEKEITAAEEKALEQAKELDKEIQDFTKAAEDLAKLAPAIKLLEEVHAEFDMVKKETAAKEAAYNSALASLENLAKKVEAAKQAVEMAEKTYQASLVLTITNGEFSVTFADKKVENDYKLSVTAITEDKILADIKAKLPNSDVKVYDIHLTKAGEEAAIDGSRTVRVATSEYAGKTVKVYHLNAKGELEELATSNNENGIEFVTNHFSNFVISAEKVEKIAAPAVTPTKPAVTTQKTATKAMAKKLSNTGETTSSTLGLGLLTMLLGIFASRKKENK